MKIAIVTRYKNFPDNGAGGAETVQNMLKSVLEEAGHVVDVWGIDDAGSLKLSINPFLRTLIGECYITGQVFAAASKIHKYDLVIASGMYGFGIRHRSAVDLFHFSSYGYRENYLAIYPSLKKKIAFMRGIALEYLSARGKYVVCVSDYLKSFLERGGVRVDRVINNCIDPDKFRRDRNIIKNGKCLFVGRYDYYGKGFDILEKLAEKGVPIDCVTNIKPGKSLGFIGTVESGELVNLYNRYCIVIFPSRFESFGLVPLEAMACGTPVVMSDTGIGNHLKGIVPEFVVNGRDGDEVTKYAGQIELIMSKYNEYSEKAEKYAGKYYSYTRFRSEWLDLLKTLTAREGF